MYYGLVLVGPSPYPDGPAILASPLLHNLTHEQMKVSAQAVRDRLKADNRLETKVSMFTHAFQHDGGTTETAADCPGCIAAVAEKLEILREQEDARSEAEANRAKGESNPTQTTRKDS